MQVKKLMTRDVVTANKDATAKDVARLMMERNVGAVVIVDNRKCVGLVTDRHIAVHVVGKDLTPGDVPVSDIMVDNPTVINEDETIFKAAELCVNKGPFRRIPVVNGNDEVVGVLSVADLALVAHPLLQSVLFETEASVEEAKVEKLDIKRTLRKEIKAIRH